MIRGFRDGETQRVFEGERSRRLPPNIQTAAQRKLRMLNRANRLLSLTSPPGNRLERLSGNRAGQHSIRINDQWRICFEWSNDHAYEVEITDYH